MCAMWVIRGILARSMQIHRSQNALWVGGEGKAWLNPSKLGRKLTGTSKTRSLFLEVSSNRFVK